MIRFYFSYFENDHYFAITFSHAFRNSCRLVFPYVHIFSLIFLHVHRNAPRSLYKYMLHLFPVSSSSLLLLQPTFTSLAFLGFTLSSVSILLYFCSFISSSLISLLLLSLPFSCVLVTLIFVAPLLHSKQYLPFYFSLCFYTQVKLLSLSFLQSQIYVLSLRIS